MQNGQRLEPLAPDRGIPHSALFTLHLEGAFVF